MVVGSHNELEGGAVHRNGGPQNFPPALESVRLRFYERAVCHRDVKVKRGSIRFCADITKQSCQLEVQPLVQGLQRFLLEHIQVGDCSVLEPPQAKLRNGESLNRESA